MKVVYTESFFKSLEKLNQKEKPFYKFIEFIRSDLPNFFKNIYRFRKELLNFKDWDYMFNLQIFYKSLIFTRDYIKNYGYEESSQRKKKIEKMDRVLYLLNTIIEDKFISIAEETLNKTINCSFKNPTKDEKEIFKLAQKLESQYWEELWVIIKGSDNVNIFNFDLTNKLINGSNMKSWWD